MRMEEWGHLKPGHQEGPVWEAWIHAGVVLCVRRDKTTLRWLDGRTVVRSRSLGHVLHRHISSGGRA